jgi:opacity protein-like surface antigen
MTRCPLMKQSFILLFAAATTFIFTPSEVLASPFIKPASQVFCQTWRPLIAVGGGLAISANLKHSKTFPIVNPVTDQFFIYHTKNEHTAGFFDIFVGAEWAYLPEWSLQMGIDYNQAGHFDVKGTLIQGADILSQDRFRYRYRILARQVLAEGKLLYNFLCSCNQLHPYILVGLGGSFNKAKDFHTSVPPFLTFTREYDNHNQSSFSYALGLGVDVDMTRCIRFGLGYRFTDFGRVKLGRATIDSVAVRGTLSRSRFLTHEALAQLTFVI